MDKHKKLHTTLLILLCFVFANTVAFAQVGTTTSNFEKAGGSGAQFLKIGVGARAMGMGGGFGAIADDITSLFWNPSGAAYLKGVNVGIEYNSWFADLQHSFTALSFPINDEYTLGISFITLGSGDIGITTIEQPEGTGSTYQASDLSVGVTLAGKVTEYFAFGVTGKYVRNSIFDVSADLLLFDIGTIYTLSEERIKIGLSVSNLGAEGEFNGQSLTVLVDDETNKQNGINARPLDATLNNTPFSAPLSFRGGISYNFFRNLEDQSLVVAGDFIHLSDNPEKFNAGAEYTWNSIVAVRSGYQFGYDEMGFTVGGSVMSTSELFKGAFDYAYADLGLLGFSNRIGVRLKF